MKDTKTTSKRRSFKRNERKAKKRAKGNKKLF